MFACFNGMQKLTRSVFQRWLTHYEGDAGQRAVAAGGERRRPTRGCARRRAGAGVSAERLIFAPKAAECAASGAHRRWRTCSSTPLPYGAHSTAADALTVGLPILTLPGRGFAARFCASVVTAAGLDDLVCANAEDYVRRAVAFGRHPESLAYYRDRLARHREASVLRDIPGAGARARRTVLSRCKPSASRGGRRRRI